MSDDEYIDSHRSFKKRGRRKDSSSEDLNSSSNDDEGKLSSKRSKNRARNTEDAMLGVFDEIDEEGAQSSSDEKSEIKIKARLKPVEFVRRKKTLEEYAEDMDVDGEEDDVVEDIDRRDIHHDDAFIGFSRVKKGGVKLSDKSVYYSTSQSAAKLPPSLPPPPPLSSISSGVGIGGSSIMTNRKFAEMFRNDMKGSKSIGASNNGESTATNRVRFEDDRREETLSSLGGSTGLGVLKNELEHGSSFAPPDVRSGLGISDGGETLQQMPAPVLGKDFANFEKHTKGFGAKYLEKFSFKGRLGKREQGIAQPIDVQVRPNMLGLGYGGFKEVTKANLVIARDRAAGHGDAAAAAQAAAEASNASSKGENNRKGVRMGDDSDIRGIESYEDKLARRAKRDEAAALRAASETMRLKAKKEYQSAAELLAADEAASFGKVEPSSLWQNELSISSGGVIDMRGPSVRVLSSLGDAGASLPDAEEPAEDDSSEKKRPGRDLIISLGRLLSESEIDLRRANARIRTHESSAKILEREFTLAQASLSRKVFERNELSSAKEALELFFDTVKSGIKSAASSSSPSSSSIEQRQSQTSSLISVLDNSAASFECLKNQHKRAFTLLHLVTSGPLVVHQILKRLVKTWEPPVNVIDSSQMHLNHRHIAQDSESVSVFVDDDGEIRDENTARLVKSLWRWAIALSYQTETTPLTNSSSEGHLFSRPRFFDSSDNFSESSEQNEQYALEKVRVEGESSAKYFQAVIETTILSSVKSAINASWNPISSPKALISLIEALSPRPSALYFKDDGAPLVIAEPVSNQAIRELLSLCILPRLLSSIESWSPETDPLPAQDWTLPWSLPHLLGNDARAQLFPPLRFKLQETLAHWHPSDASAITVLKPWAGGIWDEHDKLLGDLIVRTIIPKLVTLLRDITIVSTLEKSREVIDVFSWITRWGALMPAFHFSCLLEGEFFKKWLAALTLLLSLGPTTKDAHDSRSAPDFVAVLAWYEEWRPAFPSFIFSSAREDRFLSIFSLSLDLIEASLNVINWEDPKEVYIASTCAAELLNSRGVGPDSRTSYALSIDRRNAAKANEAIENPHRAQKTLASQSVNGVIAGLGQSKLSFREFVEATASSAGFGLVPTRLRGGVSLAVDSTHVFLLGDAGQGIIVQLDRGVVFVQDDQGWTPMSVDSAIESARSKRAKSLQREKH